MHLFEYSDYKQFIEAKVHENKAVRGYRTQLAKIAGCQKSFFSHVTRSHVHLTPDHAVGLCEFWAFDSEETEYFLALVDHARAGSKKLKTLLEQRMRRIRKHRADITQRISSDEIRDREAEALYHSAWFWNALHMIVAIPKYQTVSAIAGRLQMEPSRVSECLQQLEKMKLVSFEKGKWSITNRSIHLDPSSPMREMHHSQWRARAMQDVQKRTPDSVHYNAIFAISEEDARRVKEIIAEMVVNTRQIIAPSTEEELFCLCIDYFQV